MSWVIHTPHLRGTAPPNNCFKLKMKECLRSLVALIMRPLAWASKVVSIVHGGTNLDRKSGKIITQGGTVVRRGYDSGYAQQYGPSYGESYRVREYYYAPAPRVREYYYVDRNGCRRDW